jgi:hypothetical protein
MDEAVSYFDETRPRLRASYLIVLQIKTRLTQWRVLVTLSLRQQGISSLMLFEILARRAKISNKRKEKYYTAVGQSADCVNPKRFGLLHAVGGV